MTSPLAELLGELDRALSAVGIPWYLFGAQAAIVHGAARLTADVDATVALSGQTPAALVAALSGAGFEPRIADPLAFMEQTRVLPVVHVATRIPVDLVIAGAGLEEAFLGRAVRREIDGVRIPVACAEDVLAMKVFAGRDKDLDDALAVAATQLSEIDLERVRETLSLLEAALDRGDLLPRLEAVLTRARRLAGAG